jgi:DNA-binding LacI/PurR family transcriptional regulator
MTRARIAFRPTRSVRTARRLPRMPLPPSAIFAASDTQAIGVLAAADRLGVPVPDQLSVVGFDDIESAAFLGLSTVRQPLAHSGAVGARRLCVLLRGERVLPLRQELPLELIARASSAAYVAASHPAPKRPEAPDMMNRDIIQLHSVTCG